MVLAFAMFGVGVIIGFVAGVALSLLIAASPYRR